MTPDQIRRCAFLLRGIVEIDEWLESLSDDKNLKVRIDVDTCDDAEQCFTGYGGERSIFDKALLVSGLRHMRRKSQGELRAAGVDVPDEEATT